MRSRVAVGASGSDRVERVGDRDDARADRNVGAGEAVGIAGPVDALVVAANDRGQLRVAERRDHRRAVAGMALDQRELLLGEPAGLGQDRPRHVDLADVVHECGRADPRHLLGRQAQLARNALRVASDPAAVAMRVGVARLEQRAHAPQQVRAGVAGCDWPGELSGSCLEAPLRELAPDPAPEQQVPEDEVARPFVALPERGEQAGHQHREHRCDDHVERYRQRRPGGTKPRNGQQRQHGDGHRDGHRQRQIAAQTQRVGPGRPAAESDMRIFSAYPPWG